MLAEEERYAAQHCFSGHVKEQNIFCQRTQVSHACSVGEICSMTPFFWSCDGTEYILPEDCRLVMPAQEVRYAARHRYSGHMKEQNIFCQRTQVSHACLDKAQHCFSGHKKEQNIFCQRTQVRHACSFVLYTVL